MVGWHYRLNGCEFGWALGAGVGQGGLVCCGPWGHKVGHDRATELNLIISFNNLAFIYISKCF